MKYFFTTHPPCVKNVNTLFSAPENIHILHSCALMKLITLTMENPS